MVIHEHVMGQCSVLLCSFPKTFPTFFEMYLEIFFFGCHALLQNSTRLTGNNRFRIRSSFLQVEKVPNPVDLDEECKDRSFLQEPTLLIHTVEKLKALEAFL